jgi:hypothetical protein
MMDFRANEAEEHGLCKVPNFAQVCAHFLHLCSIPAKFSGGGRDQTQHSAGSAHVHCLAAKDARHGAVCRRRAAYTGSPAPVRGKTITLIYIQKVNLTMWTQL